MKDGGQAFPRTKVPGEDDGDFGMSLRDWFAGQAITGMLASNDAHYGQSEHLVSCAYMVADAMLKTREAQS